MRVLLMLLACLVMSGCAGMEKAKPIQVSESFMEGISNRLSTIDSDMHSIINTAIKAERKYNERRQLKQVKPVVVSPSVARSPVVTSAAPVKKTELMRIKEELDALKDSQSGQGTAETVMQGGLGILVAAGIAGMKKGKS